MLTETHTQKHTSSVLKILLSFADLAPRENIKSLRHKIKEVEAQVHGRLGSRGWWGSRGPQPSSSVGRALFTVRGCQGTSQFSQDSRAGLPSSKEQGDNKGKDTTKERKKTASLCVGASCQMPEGNGGLKAPEHCRQSPGVTERRRPRSPQDAVTARQSAHQDRQSQRRSPAGRPWPSQEGGQLGGQEADTSPPPGLSGVRWFYKCICERERCGTLSEEGPQPSSRWTAQPPPPRSRWAI